MISKFLKVQFFGANISSTMTSLKVLEGPGPEEISCRAGPTRVFKMATRSNENLSFVCISLVFFLIFRQVESNKIRGVAVTKLPLYDSSRDFTCLDGSKTINFTSVNDDYCDCEDSSDEPGTSACPNGRFHCTNAGFKPRNIPSSRVNDQICDCCDGSDEYDSGIVCLNNCKELYKAHYEKRLQEIELSKQGYAKKLEYIKEGQTKKEERKQKLEELKQELVGKQAAADEVKGRKEAAEAIEKEAKDKHEKEWEATKVQILADRDKEAAEAAFNALDTDSTGTLTVTELAASKSFDKEYTEDEIREFLGGYEDTDMTRFTSELWVTFREKYKPQKDEPQDESKKDGTDDQTAEVPSTDSPPPTEPPVPTPPVPPAPLDDNMDAELKDDDDEDDDEGDDEGEEDVDDLRRDADKKSVSPDSFGDGAKKDKEDDLKMPEYDQETKLKIEAADQVRKEFEDADRAKRDIETDIANIEKILNLDLGENQEFAHLQGQCYEFRDREYLYKLCPFEKVTQQPKDGGSETSLGTWGSWTGEPNKYSRQKYSGGQGCWNGPDRSADIKLSCGSSDELISVTEPNRCEYSMEFRTLALCEDLSEQTHDLHEEL